MSSREYLEPLQLAVEQSKSRGRFLVTKKQIPAGTTILSCNPLSYAITNDKQKNVCCYCYKEYAKLSTCSKCNCACYCSRQCQVADWKSHKIECGWMKKIADLKQPMNSYILIMRMVYQLCTHSATCSNENNIITGDYTDILDHHDNLEITDAESIEKYNEVCDIIYDIASKQDWFNEERCSKKEILSCIGRLYNNRFSVMNYENTEIAIGMYPVVYLINHRCTPNAAFIFDGTRLILRSIATIHKNEEISISYIDVTKPTYLRNTVLKAGYSFRCSCPLCKDLQRDKKLYSFRCPCGGVQYPTFTNNSSRPELWVCETCGKEGYYADEYRIIEDEQCYSLLIWLQTDDGYSYKKTLELYKEYKEKCTEDNFLYIKLLQYLLTYFIALKRVAESEEISQILLRFASTYQIPNCRALVQENISCGKLDKGLGKGISAIRFYKKALEIATITDGEETPLCHYIRGLISDVELPLTKPKPFH